jgi:hypothetical protein
MPYDPSILQGISTAGKLNEQANQNTLQQQTIKLNDAKIAALPYEQQVARDANARAVTKDELAIKKSQLEQAAMKTAQRTQMLYGVNDQATHDMLRNRLLQEGEDISDIPTVYDPAWKQFEMQQGVDLKSRIDMQKNELESMYKAATFEETKRHNMASEDNARAAIDAKPEVQTLKARQQVADLLGQAEQLKAAGKPEAAAQVAAQAEQITAEIPRKLSATEQKEFYEAEDKATAATGVIGALDDALKINNKAFSGFGSSTLAAANRVPLIGSFINDEAATATTELNNIILSQALESLKVTFGAAPTEGERKILIDLQASVDKTPKEREVILKRAKEAAERRQKDAKRKMQGVATGEIYKDGEKAPDAPSYAKMSDDELMKVIMGGR